MSEQQASRRSMATALLAFMALPMAACQSSSPQPQQMARTTLQTAPADLQLLCANAVATQTGTPADKVLPTSSRQTEAGWYQVELNAAGKTHSCVVDAEGNVSSVTAL